MDSHSPGGNADIIRRLLVEHSSMRQRLDATEQIYLSRQEENARLRTMLDKATVRLAILRDRMEACDIGGNFDGNHELSRFEIDGWVEEQSRAARSGTPE